MIDGHGQGPLLARILARRDQGVPVRARRIAGFELRRVQEGLEPTDWKWLAEVGPGVQEIRVHTGQEHRVFYVARFAEGVYVLHAFEKRTRRTPRHELDLARRRFRELLDKRRKEGHEKGHA